MPMVSEAPGTGGRVLILEPRFIVGTEVLLEILNSVFEGCFEVNAVHPCLRYQAAGTTHLVAMRNTMRTVITRDIDRSIEALKHETHHKGGNPPPVPDGIDDDGKPFRKKYLKVQPRHGRESALAGYESLVTGSMRSWQMAETGGRISSACATLPPSR